jgi:hypothetical protein
MNYPPAERAAIILSYDRRIDLIMESLRSRSQTMKHIENPKELTMLHAYHAREKRDLAEFLNIRLTLCEEYSRSKTQ